MYKTNIMELEGLLIYYVRWRNFRKMQRIKYVANIEEENYQNIHSEFTIISYVESTVRTYFENRVNITG